MVKLNEQELGFLTGSDDLARGARWVLERGPSLCCVSLGAQGSYFATKGDGMIWAGTTEEEVDFDETITEAARDEILLPLARFFPPLLDAEIVQQTACLRPVSADGAPIVGPVPGVEGLFVATAGGRKGILMSPALGRIAADFVTDGQTGLLDATPYVLDRFGPIAATP